VIDKSFSISGIQTLVLLTYMQVPVLCDFTNDQAVVTDLLLLMQ